MEKCWIAELTEIDSETWCNDLECDSREAAIEEGMILAKEEGMTCFRIAKATPCGIPSIDGEYIIDDLQNQLCSEVGEVGEDYLEDATKEQINELEEQLNEVFYNWNIKHGFEPNCYTIEESEWIKVK